MFSPRTLTSYVMKGMRASSSRDRVLGATERERKVALEAAALSRYSITYAVMGLPPLLALAVQLRESALEEAAVGDSRIGAEGGTENDNNNIKTIT